MNRWTLSARIVLFVLLLTGILSVLPRSAAADPEPPPPALGTPGPPWVVRAYYTDRDMVARLAQRVEPWEVNGEAGYVVVEVDEATYTWIESLGFRVELDEKLTGQLHRPLEPLDNQISGIVGYPCYRTVEETFNAAALLATDYRDLAEWTDVGDSWEKVTSGGAPGYDMWVLRLTNEKIPGPKPKLFVMSAVHAREYTTAELATRFAEYLLSNYDVDPDLTWLLDYHEIHVMLQANPDGRKHAESGLSWRKNTNENYCSPTSTRRGADLNRNFSFKWGCCGGSSNDPCYDTYRGAAASSEPEVQAIQAYVRSQFPDQRAADLSAAAPLTTTGVFLDLHSYSELVLWPWGFTYGTSPNHVAMQTLGRKFTYFNGYTAKSSSGLYITDGTTTDFAYGELGLAAYTFELGTTFFQDCGTFEDTIVPDNLPALVYAAKVARTPYLTPSGPDALNAGVSKAVVIAGETITLSASVDDTRYNNRNGTELTQNVAGAAFYVDEPPWSTDAVAHAMAAADGAFDEKSEDVVAVVDTAGTAPGRHFVFVQGEDAEGNLGVVGAAFLYVVDPEVSPVIKGYVRDLLNVPLEATISTGSIEVQTDPTSGYYETWVLSDTLTLVADADGYASAEATLTVQNGETLYHTFYLTPSCTILLDNVENGNQDWTAEDSWAITSESYHSIVHSWTDSPGANYSNGMDSSLISPAWDLSGYENVVLSFWHKYDLEGGYDYGYVEYSTDGGNSWAAAENYTGKQSAWGRETLSLPALDRQSQVRIRFRLDSDSSLTADGWYVDDVELIGSSSVCVSPMAPRTDFSFAKPVAQGDVVAFTNNSFGSIPLTHLWDFGDGVTSTAEHPTHTYALPGDYTIYLTVTNAYGTDVRSSELQVRRTLTWEGSVDGDWHRAENWDGGAVPTAADKVVVPAAPAGGRWPTVTAAATCYDLVVQAAAQMTLTDGIALTVAGSVDNAGRLHQHRQVAPGAGPVAFFAIPGTTGADRYAGVAISPSASMGEVAVTVRGNESCGMDGTLPETVSRCFLISPEISQTAVITFYYTSAEANGNVAPQVYHHEGGDRWSLVPTLPVSQTTGAIRFVAATVSDYSHFALADGPGEPLALHIYAASSAGGWPFGLVFLAGVAAVLASAAAQRRRR